MRQPHARTRVPHIKSQVSEVIRRAIGAASAGQRAPGGPSSQLGANMFGARTPRLQLQLDR